LTEGRGLPKISVQDSTTINTQLGENALPNGFVSVPVFTFVNNSVLDDVNFNGCEFVHDQVEERRYNNANYNDYWWVRNFV